jgi:anaerobic ribonucleoside-triphosphate reductase
MEPITTIILAERLWEYLGEPIVDKIKDNYAEKVLVAVKKLQSKFSLNKEEKEIIETEIIDVDFKNIQTKEDFIEFIDKNEKIQRIINTLNQKNINIKVEKGVGYISTMNGDINF